jgi:hypothetical protein
LANIRNASGHIIIKQKVAPNATVTWLRQEGVELSTRLVGLSGRVSEKVLQWMDGTERTIFKPSPIWASLWSTIRIHYAGAEIDDIQNTVRPADNIPKLEVMVVDISVMKLSDDVV